MENDTELTQTEMVAVFSSSSHDAEMEALTIKGVLDSNGMPAQVVGPQVLPNLEFQVWVSQDLAAEAAALIEEARAAGPAAAAEAEALTEF
ncbi:MAG: hypothetical protein ABUS49_01870 [Acidobacteriota bacterium]